MSSTSPMCFIDSEIEVEPKYKGPSVKVPGGLTRQNFPSGEGGVPHTVAVISQSPAVTGGGVPPPGGAPAGVAPMAHVYGERYGLQLINKSQGPKFSGHSRDWADFVRKWEDYLQLVRDVVPHQMGIPSCCAHSRNASTKGLTVKCS